MHAAAAAAAAVSRPSALLAQQMMRFVPYCYSHVVHAAAAGSACPVVIFTPGFLLNSSLYRSYAMRLASWGYTVLLWDLSDVLDDTLTCAYMKQV
jgi:pimeloyl-ACP methyl ester carboxylesterase